MSQEGRSMRGRTPDPQDQEVRQEEEAAPPTRSPCAPPCAWQALFDHMRECLVCQAWEEGGEGRVLTPPSSRVRAGLLPCPWCGATQPDAHLEGCDPGLERLDEVDE
jgi:hypothetical protein